MHRSIPICLLALALLATGCQSTKPVARTYHDALTDSRQAIVRGQTTVASQRLDEARRLAVAEGTPATEADLLEAEVSLRDNRVTDALVLVRDVLSREATNPRANEVYGKALLLNGGPFDDADRAFSKAKTGYIDPADQQRVDDLIALARGLAAYAAGDPEVARNYFKEIRDPDLRFSVDQAAREAARNGLAQR